MVIVMVICLLQRPRVAMSARFGPCVSLLMLTDPRVCDRHHGLSLWAGDGMLSDARMRLCTRPREAKFMAASGPGCVKSRTGQKCVELISQLPSRDGGCWHYSFIRSTKSRRKF